MKMTRRQFTGGLFGTLLAGTLGLIPSPQSARALPGGGRSGGPESLDRSGEGVQFGRVEGFGFYLTEGDEGEPMHPELYKTGNRLLTPDEMAKEGLKVWRKEMNQIGPGDCEMASQLSPTNEVLTEKILL